MRYREAAQCMLDELEAGCLCVTKGPGASSGYVRIVLSQNADWYRRFCREWVRHRRDKRYKPRTIIKRCHTENALRRIIDGRAEGCYAERLHWHVKHYMAAHQRGQEVFQTSLLEF